jgi:hypothetical protein
MYAASHINTNYHCQSDALTTRLDLSNELDHVTYTLGL